MKNRTLTKGLDRLALLSVATSTQFNFELPEEETNILLDVGVARKMGLTRDTVQKAMIARAMVLERLDQIAPKGTPSLAEHRETLAKVGVALEANPDFRTQLKKLLSTSARSRRSRQPAAA